jgi:SPP1 family predicted phage head-tail adaptor
MNHRITLLQRTTGKDAAGQPTEDWPDVATIWADVRFQSGAEVLRSNAEVAVKRASVRIRARADVTPAWRVRYAGEEYDVKSVLPDVDRSFAFLVVENVK